MTKELWTGYRQRESSTVSVPDLLLLRALLNHLAEGCRGIADGVGFYCLLAQFGELGAHVAGDRGIVQKLGTGDVKTGQVESRLHEFGDNLAPCEEVGEGVVRHLGEEPSPDFFHERAADFVERDRRDREQERELDGGAGLDNHQVALGHEVVAVVRYEGDFLAGELEAVANHFLQSRAGDGAEEPEVGVTLRQSLDQFAEDGHVVA